MSSQKLTQGKIYLWALTNQMLKDLCKIYKIKGFSNLNKEELIDFILKSIPKANFDNFLREIEDKSLNAIISLVPKYFLKENQTKLDSLIFDNKNTLLKLRFKGFRWEIFTEIHFQNLDNNQKPLEFNFNCTCEYAKEGGICSHCWVGIIWAFQKFSMKNSRWKRTKLPENFNHLKETLNFTSFYKESSKSEKLDISSVEDFLKVNLMGKTEFNFKDLEDLSIKDILDFISILAIKIPEEKQLKPKKSKLIELIKSQVLIEDFNKKFFEFKRSIRISEAKEIPVDIVNVDWGPPFNCHARLRVIMEEQEKIMDIFIKNNEIKHSNCHWVYHRQNFCSHLVALFLALSIKNPLKTLYALKELII